MDFKLMILASTPEEAIEAQNAGVDRIFFDLEYLNKAERQRGRNTVISNNDIDDIPKVRKVVNQSELLVRTNPIHAYTEVEVNKAISYGADILMLPMVLDKTDVEKYVSYVKGRAKVCIMVETAQAMSRIDSILAVPGVDEIFIGLNDLHISLGLSFMFETLSGGLVEYIANKCNAANMPFGFGGIARIGEGMLPADNILGEHVRLGSMSVILSRTFKGGDTPMLIDFKSEVDKVRAKYDEISRWSTAEFVENQDRIKDVVDKIVYRNN